MHVFCRVSVCVCVRAGRVNEDNRTERVAGSHIHTHTVSAGPLGSKCRCRSGGSSRPTLSSQWEADFHSAVESTLPGAVTDFGKGNEEAVIPGWGRLANYAVQRHCMRGKVPPLCAKQTPRFSAPLTAAAAAKSHGSECQRAHGRLVLWRNKCNRFALWRGNTGVERKQDARVETQWHGLKSANKQWLIIVLL